MSKYTLVILCGKAGAGKDYLLRKLKDHYGDKLNYIVSDTTRPPRDGEVDGVDYNFKTFDEWHEKSSHRQYLEMTCYEIAKDEFWFYGTPYSSLVKNKINIGIFNIDGIKQLYEKDDLNIKIFYISANDRTRLLRQINREEYPDCAEICRRFLADEQDFKNLTKYPFTKIRNSSGVSDDQCVDYIIEEINQLDLVLTE